jgi:hypothetical protein
MSSKAFARSFMSTSSIPDIPELERALLSALCSVDLSTSERSTILLRLAGHTWRHPDHQVTYAALRSAPKLDRVSLRAYLIAEVTRLGFPDIDFTRYFAPSSLAITDVAKLAGSLLAAEPSAAKP